MLTTLFAACLLHLCIECCYADPTHGPVHAAAAWRALTRCGKKDVTAQRTPRGGGHLPVAGPGGLEPVQGLAHALEDDNVRGVRHPRGLQAGPGRAGPRSRASLRSEVRAAHRKRPQVAAPSAAIPQPVHGPPTWGSLPRALVTKTARWCAH